MLLRLQDAEVFTPARRGRVDILVSGGRILAVAPSLDVKGIDVQTVNMRGATVIPGLVDPHVHLGGGGGEAGFGSRLPEVHASELVAAGITTVVGVLGTDSITRTPLALLAVARKIAAAGLTARMWTGAYRVPPPSITGDVRTDIVVVPEVIGVGEVAISDHRGSAAVADLVRLGIDCHVGGLLSGKTARLHLHVGNGRQGLEPLVRAVEDSALPPSTFHPTHVNRTKELWDQACDLARKGVTLDVTAGDMGADGIEAADAVLDFLSRGLPRQRLTISSDSGGSVPTFDAEGRITRYASAHPDVLLQTLSALIDRTDDVEGALSMMTAGVATYLGLPHKGRLEPGADADLCVLDERWRPTAVLCRGRWLMKDGAPIASAEDAT